MTLQILEEDSLFRYRVNIPFDQVHLKSEYLRWVYDHKMIAQVMTGVVFFRYERDAILFIFWDSLSNPTAI